MCVFVGAALDALSSSTPKAAILRNSILPGSSDGKRTTLERSARLGTSPRALDHTSAISRSCARQFSALEREPGCAKNRIARSSTSTPHAERKKAPIPEDRGQHSPHQGQPTRRAVGGLGCARAGCPSAPQPPAQRGRLRCLERSDRPPRARAPCRPPIAPPHPALDALRPPRP